MEQRAVRSRARDIINEVLTEVAPEHLELLLKILEIEELHLADKSSVAPAQIAALIEKTAKTVGAIQ